MNKKELQEHLLKQIGTPTNAWSRTINCDFCFGKCNDRNVLRDAYLEKKDGSDIFLCNSCLTNYVNADYEEISKRTQRNFLLQHQCDKSKDKIVMISLDKIGNSLCGYCNQIVNYKFPEIPLGLHQKFKED